MSKFIIFSLFKKVGRAMNQKEFCMEIGTKIRAFRKLKHLTQKQLADQMHKSLACISKYEKGEIVMDICTLYECANALNIIPQMLLPQNTADSIVANPAPQKLPQFFQHTPLYYYGIRSNRAETVAAAIEIDPENGKVTVYFDLTDPVNYRNSKYILHGDIFCSDANIRIFCSNPFLGGDFIMINCRTAALMDDRVFAFAATLTPNYRIRASKAILTPERLHNPNSILPQLKITKEQLKEAKKNDYFVF